MQNIRKYLFAKQSFHIHLIMLISLVFFLCSTFSRLETIAHAGAVKKWDVNTKSGITHYEAVMHTSSGKVALGHETVKRLYKNDNIFWSAALDFDGSAIFAGGRPAAILKYKEGGFHHCELENSSGNVRIPTKDRSFSVLKKISGERAMLGGMAGSGVIVVRREGQLKYSKLCSLPSETTWDLEDAGGGFAYASTGPLGQIFRINLKDGAYDLWGQVKDANLRFIYKSKNGRIFAGGGETGNLYELKGKGRMEVVWHFNEEVVQRIVEHGNGFLVAVNKMRKAPEEKKEEVYKKYFQEVSSLNAIYGVDSTSLAGLNPMETVLSNISNGTVYYLGNDYRIEKLMSLNNEYVLDMVLGAEGRVFLGTGPRARVYMVENIFNDDREIWTVHDFDYKNVNSILMMEGRPAFFLASGNEAVVFKRASEVSEKGMFRTGVFSTGIPSDWGRLAWSGKGLTVYSRHGNTPTPDDSWTKWIKRKTGDPAELPSRTWSSSQIRFELKAKDARFHGFTSYYVEKNVKPLVKNITISQRKLRERGPSRDIGWEMSDPNGDDLICSLWIKEEGAKKWLKLTKDISVNEKKYVLQTASLPDGRYVLKVLVSDEASNYPFGLDGFALSSIFTIDNRRPRFSSLKFEPIKKRFTGKVMDEQSVLGSLAFSIDGEKWIKFSPSDGILDEKDEEINLPMLGNLEKGEYAISFRAIDEAGNMTNEILTISY